MVNNEIVNENIIGPFLRADLSVGIDEQNLVMELMQKVIVSDDVSAENDMTNIINSVLRGDTLLLLEHSDQALVISTKGFQTRPISEPDSAKVIRGPREGFTESLIINLSLLRRKISSPDLKFKFRKIGTRTQTKTCICYIEGLAKDGIIRELEKRLDDIDIDAILDSGYIQELIRDAPFSPFETVGSNERPDVTAGKLLEGRVALFVDGSPFVLTVPFVAVENFQSNEDYYTNYIISSINRFLRGATAIATIVIPAIYLSIVTFHQEMLPTPLLLSIAAARQDVPLPTSVSLFLMLLIFDIIREATTRMPTTISQSIAIIGTIVLGQAAVEAKLVGAPVLIITALTGITTLINTKLLGAFVVYRYVMLIGASFYGIYGFLMCYIVLMVHLMGIRSFGVPYMIGETKVKNHDGQDAWIRAPWWTMTLRPKIIGAKNLVRQSSNKSRTK
jgi:spore germination protein KA